MELLSSPVFYALLPWLLFILGAVMLVSSVIRRRIHLQSKLYQTIRNNEKAVTLASIRSKSLHEELYNRKVFSAKLIPLPPLKQTKTSKEILQAIEQFQNDRWVIYRAD